VEQPGKKKDPADSASASGESTHGEAVALLYQADCWWMLKIALGGFTLMVVGAILAALPVTPSTIVALGILLSQLGGAASTGAFGAWTHATWKLHREAEPAVSRAAFLGEPGGIRPYFFGLVMAAAGALVLLGFARAVAMKDIRHSEIRARIEAVNRALQQEANR
jgi:hypothetical protein